jgi:hypothetical protein
VFEEEGDEGEPFDAAFIAHARTDIPALLAHIAEQDAALEAAEKRADGAEMRASTLVWYINADERYVAQRIAVTEAERDSLREEVERLREDAARLDALMDESWDLRCFGMSDDDIGWRVIGHWQAEPSERTIAEVFTDNPRAAIDAALTKKEQSDGQG